MESRKLAIGRWRSIRKNIKGMSKFLRIRENETKEKLFTEFQLKLKNNFQVI